MKQTVEEWNSLISDEKAYMVSASSSPCLQSSNNCIESYLWLEYNWNYKYTVIAKF